MERLMHIKPQGFGRTIEALRAAHDNTPAVLSKLKAFVLDGVGWLHHGLDLSLSFIGDITGRISTFHLYAFTRLAKDKATADATQAMATALHDRLREDLTFILKVIFFSALGLLIFVLMPLLYKAITRRRLSIFISFSHVQEEIAQSLERRLLSENLDVHRLAFRRGREHQEVVTTAEEAETICDVVVCIPDRTASFVDNEISFARGREKAITFLISEFNGTLPNSANKRFPMFKLETLIEDHFDPLVPFLRFIGADLSSTWKICKDALVNSTLVACTSNMIAGVALAIMSFWVYCLIRVKLEADVLMQHPPIPANYASNADFVLSNIVVLGLLGTLAIGSAIFAALVVQQLVQGLSASRKARLKAESGLFRRDDWIGVIPGLTRESSVYRAMFEDPPRAHHEQAA